MKMAGKTKGNRNNGRGYGRSGYWRCMFLMKKENSIEKHKNSS